jgi:C1A family cysteine protease
MFATVAVAMLATSAVADLSTASPASHKMMFESFKAQHTRSYKTQDEENTRFKTFVSNLAVIDARNHAERKAGGSAQHAVTKFSDISEEDFLKRLNYVKSNETAKFVAVAPHVGASTSVDWTGVYTTPVKNQGYCGSCWAFAASEQMESDSMRTLGTNFILGPEQMVECDRSSAGCDGGLQERAYSYVERAGGMQEESTYPYTSGVDGSTSACSSDKSKFVLTVTDYANIDGETDMSNYVLATGPVSVALDASTWSSYTGGIMSVCPTQINHAVQAVGVDTSSGGYWKVRNSWGPDWGESGFIRLSYGSNTCGITSDVSYTTTATV